MAPAFTRLEDYANKMTETYQRLRDYRVMLAVADEQALDARTQFETAKFGLMAAKQLTGSNEAARDLEARTKLPEQYAELLRTERAQRDAKLKVQLAELDREELRLTLRLAELLAGENKGYQVIKENGGE